MKQAQGSVADLFGTVEMFKIRSLASPLTPLSAAARLDTSLLGDAKVSRCCQAAQAHESRRTPRPIRAPGDCRSYSTSRMLTMTQYEEALSWILSGSRRSLH